VWRPNGEGTRRRVYIDCAGAQFISLRDEKILKFMLNLLKDNAV